MGIGGKIERKRRVTSEIPALPDLAFRLRAENEALRRERDALLALREQAFGDPLTGLRNRRYFDERLAEELARYQRHPERGGGALVAIDVDDFKDINDQHGHRAGDRVLRDLAGLIRTTLRLEDICCRTGGDEMMVILPGTNVEGARGAIRRLRSAVGRRNATARVKFDISMGFATWPGDAATFEKLVAVADRGLYADKARAPHEPGPRGTGLRMVH